MAVRSVTLIKNKILEQKKLIETISDSTIPYIRRAIHIPIVVGNNTVNTTFVTFAGFNDGLEHIAVLFKEIVSKTVIAPLVQIHSGCSTGDVLSSTWCNCDPRLTHSIEELSLTGGILLYLQHKEQDTNQHTTLDAYRLHNFNYDTDHDTCETNRTPGFNKDAHDFTIAAHMLKALGIYEITLSTNNPHNEQQLREHGINTVTKHPTPYQ